MAPCWLGVVSSTTSHPSTVAMHTLLSQHPLTCTHCRRAYRLVGGYGGPLCGSHVAPKYRPQLNTDIRANFGDTWPKFGPDFGPDFKTNFETNFKNEFRNEFQPNFWTFAFVHEESAIVGGRAEDKKTKIQTKDTTQNRPRETQIQTLKNDPGHDRDTHPNRHGHRLAPTSGNGPGHATIRRDSPTARQPTQQTRPTDTNNDPAMVNP